MLTVSNRMRLTFGYIGLRLNHCDVEAASKWADYMRRYWHLYNSNASQEVLDHYLATEDW